MSSSHAPSRLLDYLPEVFRSADAEQPEAYLGTFLIAFEKILLGRSDGISLPAIKDSHQAFPNASLEEQIDRIPELFDPQKTPEDFLVWLSQWTAFSLRNDLEPSKQRSFIAKIMSLYRRRGTKANLQELLKIFTIGESQIEESSTQAHFFQVTIALNRMAPELLERQLAIARSLIDLEKPAHTYYELLPQFPSMQIGVYSTVGVDTVIGTIPDETTNTSN